jgi:hypothetical protein
MFSSPQRLRGTSVAADGNQNTACKDGIDAVGRSADRPPWSGDVGAEQLLAAVRDACGEGEDLPSSLEAGLRAALAMLAADPELAHVLTVGPWPGEEDGGLGAKGEWTRRFCGLLSGAVASDPRTTASDSSPTS